MTNPTDDLDAAAIAAKVQANEALIERANTGDRAAMLDLARAMMRGDIQPAEQDEEAITERDLTADDPFAVQSVPINAQDFAGAPLQVRGFTVHQSTQNEGEGSPIFIAIEAVLLPGPTDGWSVEGPGGDEQKFSPGDVVVLTCGMRRVIARLFNAAANGHLPTPADRPVTFTYNLSKKDRKVWRIEYLDA